MDKPCLSAVRYHQVANASFERLVERGKQANSTVIVRTARLRRIAYGVLTRDAPFATIPKKA